MPRSPFQIIVVPFRRVGEQIEFAVFRREDIDVWQAVAGGGESGESPEQTAARETREELGLDGTVALYPLQATASVSARIFADHPNWPAGLYVVPEHSFAADSTDVEIKLSDEHTAVQWLDYKSASGLLRFDSNRAALGEPMANAPSKPMSTIMQPPLRRPPADQRQRKLNARSAPLRN